ncbi:MAG TPA: hypothetical protein VIY08_08075, partial [Candidatus Nitrosocosmicus sp.]
FNLDQSNIYTSKRLKLIRKCIPIPQRYITKQRGFESPEEVEQHFPGFLAFIDSTEQQIPKPIKNKRKIFYLDKKKRHTVKTKLMVKSNVNDMLYLLVN